MILQQSRPSLVTGYATNADESAYPNLWRGMRCLYAPMLGPSHNLMDLSGNKNTTTRRAAGTSTLGAAVGGFAWRANGSTRFASRETDDLVFTAGQSISLTAFVYCTSSVEQLLIGNRQSTENASYTMDFSGSKTRFFGKAALGSSYIIFTTTANTLTVNKFLAVTVCHTFGDASSTKVYVNNTLFAGTWSGSGAFTPYVPSSKVFHIGGHGGNGSYLNGNMYLAAVQRAYLSRDEIARWHGDWLAPFRRRDVFEFPEQAAGGGGGFQPAWAGRATQVVGVLAR